MSLGPTDEDRLAQARTDLRIGLPVVLKGPRGNHLIAAAETLSPDRLAALRAIGDPLVAITARRAETLKARAYDGDLARIRIPRDADPAWILALADPAADLSNPLKGPYDTVRDGPAEAHRLALRMVKSARLLPAAVVVAVSDADLAPEAAELTRLDRNWTADALTRMSPLSEVISGRVPTEISETGRLHVFRPEDGGEEHYAVEIGRPDRSSAVLVRLHSACFTGDVLGSLKCDCGPQLRAAMASIGTDGSGILLYLNQEGRGIGLANKMRTYSLQDQGFDTVEANHRLGFEDDERDFRIGAAILERLGIATVRLMTNNPAKVAMMERCGITVAERVPLAVGRNPLNEGYLDIKAKKSGHIL